MLTYPHIDPIAMNLGPLQVHWYGLMYLLAFLIAWGLAHLRVKLYHLNWTAEQISDLIFYSALGAVLGGRLGYVLFYGFAELYQDPSFIFKIWQGGMSFHGGVLGVLLAVIFYSKKTKRPFLETADFLAPLVPLGLGAGRFGNFINGELWGRVSTMPWAMVFPTADEQPRHPSQLYEIGLEGIALFIIVWCYAAKPRPKGSVMAVFLIGYAIARIIVEFFRVPDAQLGYLAFDWLTMGQILSIPMLLIGFIILWVNRNANLPATH